MDNEKNIIESYEKLDRSYFMDEYKEYASQDTPFPIGHGQTISQPSLVLRMTILLNPDKTSKVLEIGTGSGYQAALLAENSKEVYTVERIEDLYKKSKDKLLNKGYENIHFKLGDGSLGWKESGPYDRIMVTASATNLPDELIEQLAPNGRMVIPVGENSVQELLLIKKDAQGRVSKEFIAKVRFVRLVGKY